MKTLDSGAGYVRYALGDLAVVALRDGYVDMPSSRLRQAGDRPFGSDMPAQVDLVDGRLRLSVNAFLVVDRGEHILIDTGAADAWLPTMGSLLGALDEAGVARGSIGTVAFTHTHEDHVNGLVAADGSDAFPNLRRLLVPQEEIPMFDAYERLARFRQRRLPFGDGFKVSDGITAVQAHGHEVGHTAFEVSSGRETLLIWGDVIHVPSIQFDRPELTWEFDADQDQARSTRQALLRRAAQPDVFVAGAHLDFPGVGTVTASGEAFGYTPLA
ncbi:MBL fold metallo-hydrolase [Labrys wisconsinensis]|jgi:glyoxylase-like metal-dependent hydrolase (beta-lactamase superfamily II)|uniref:Glyoxylase-like metal-dependent hydrolase (Beta-lactamase superfamily II) n=1 Tax=Labrys wisconsinensis TaxID=425677 RepID=A0ABU0J2H9_9HYPH|nr:MBL fold metallo-hydrolase [Labrys wisconsinensis]MDQ0468462.1 glyoxylase-like metal-dependent hydrolase (beta-lactamase superfamily II) [Labrys wisconsinensis]